MMQLSRQQLRQQLRQRRNALSAREQREASARLCARLANHPTFVRSQRIALYLANDGEIDATPLLQRAWSMGKQCFLPVLKPGSWNELWFAPFEAGTLLTPNRYGIEEPRLHHGQHPPAWSLDLVLMPLVGFDTEGNRLGMGGGYYDRSFAFLRRPRPVHQPRLIGLAHECQRVDELPCDSWDIPLSEIITDRNRYCAERSSAETAD
ncbi:5-formyltetrahydrofolate cyclo-ligase [Aestuariirhabdus litorea]|uniref:5-formyltetrahydrofolate cyclo-ligase n=1 Tax=Aestuariirhabdus litorea TaxID=2528527 RepID=A0A3P3VJU8_9GAMM|nr:5-formyltetrahydrofolate cyclo-ligase [Aestuariirhabdus litorea]RRJ82990.1 5-formyltetrahydrofolate cyclo-ligase [Aestuariirhabdus litorea]RWW93149.1 5-formyltetrahydrofolate cyclo-ligase [Endozoicomonadaceae bacterium GTF-13]